MPRYFFHWVVDLQEIRDKVGRHLASSDEVLQVASRLVRRVASARGGARPLQCVCTVRDTAGERIYELGFPPPTPEQLEGIVKTKARRAAARVVAISREA